jgi:hypothetical protein
MPMMIPKDAVAALGEHAHRAGRSLGRLVWAGVGFSVAYYFDPGQGDARRERLRQRVRRTGGALDEALAPIFHDHPQPVDGPPVLRVATNGVADR